jgi:hypothetical protein
LFDVAKVVLFALSCKYLSNKTQIFNFHLQKTANNLHIFAESGKKIMLLSCNK